MDWPVAKEIDTGACGLMHTVLLTKSGKMYSCGNNDHGQLGHGLSRKRPRMFKLRMCGYISLVSLKKKKQMFA